MKSLRVYLGLFVLAMLTACSASIEDYKGTEPKFDFKQFFSGELVAYGIVQDYSGEVTRRFRVDMQASWQGNKGVIDEQFYYQDGEQDTRVWRIELGENGTLTGTANDVVGTAQGVTRGSAFNWKYTHSLNSLLVKTSDFLRF